jgi:heat shock protein HslJ
MKTLLKLFIISCLVYILSGCSDSDFLNIDGSLPKLTSLTGTEWTWTKYVDINGEIVNVQDKTKLPFTIKFVDDTSFTGVSGCNDFGSKYEINNGGMLIYPGCTTLVYCDYTEFFEKVLWSGTMTFSVNDTELLLNTRFSDCKQMYFIRK